MQRLNARLPAFLLFACMLGMPACRDEHPPDTYNTNLGNATRPLMPTDPLSQNNTILDGRATLVSLREPTDDLALLTDLVNKLRQLYGDGDLDGLIPLLVEEQREVAKQTNEASLALRTAVVRLKTALESIDPQPATATVLQPLIDASLELPVDPAKIELTSDTEAKLPFGPADAAITFSKTDDVWRVAMPGMGDADTALAQLQNATARVNAVAEILEDTSLGPADRDAKVMAALGGASNVNGDNDNNSG